MSIWHLTIALLVASHVGFAQENQWRNVQALHKGDRVGVVQFNQKRLEGRFDSATEARITLQTDQQITIEKSDVVRVYRPAKHSRLFGTVLGAAIGVAAGAITDATLGQYFRNETGGSPAGVITAVGGAAGAGIGAAASGWSRTVYQRSK